LKKDGTVIETELSGGIALGIIDDLPYSVKTIQLSAGDGLFLFTDGVTEAFNSNEELYSEARLEDKLRLLKDKNSEERVKFIAEDVNEYSTGVQQSDDITILALKYFGA
jgi:Serine phosphatase RsbU, regulator of sigma subunit